MKRKLLQTLAWLRAQKAPDIDPRDICVLGGLGMMFYGLHLFHPPLAWLVSGGALFWLGAIRTRR